MPRKSRFPQARSLTPPHPAGTLPGSPPPLSRTMRLPRFPPLLPLLIAALVVASCGRERQRDALSRGRFIEVNVALRRALAAPGDTAGRRVATLRRYRITARQLERWVAARQGEPEELADAWEEIARGIRAADSVARADSLRADSVRSDSIRSNGVRADSARRDSASAVPLVQVSPAQLAPQRRKKRLPRKSD